MSTLLEHPQAQALLDQTDVSPDDVRGCARHLTAFIRRYLPCFYRDEQRGHADTILRGKLTGLQRKTTEPIAAQAGQKRRPLQHFVGAGQWHDPTVRTELRRHVREKRGDPDAVLVLNNHAVAKQGQDSCGVARQWCGRLGKVENCQVGYFLAYAVPRGRTLIDARLYLPGERDDDGRHRGQTYVSQDVAFQEGWRIGLELFRTSSRELPHGRGIGDDEFGRASVLRAPLRLDGERYVLDVPCNTLVRDLSSRRPSARAEGRKRLPPFERAEVWAARQPKGRWRTLRLGDGEKGPRLVRALQQRLQTKDEDGCVGPRERLVVIRGCEKTPQTWYTLSNAGKDVPLAEVVRAHGEPPAVESAFSRHKRLLGSALRGKSDASRERECYLRVLTHNIMLLAATG